MIDSAVSLSCEQDNICYRRKPNKLQRRYVPSRSSKTDASFIKRFLGAVKKMSVSNEKQDLKVTSRVYLGTQGCPSGQHQSINDQISDELSTNLSGNLASSTIRKITQFARRHKFVEIAESSTSSTQPGDDIHAIRTGDGDANRLPTRVGSISSRKRYTISSRSLPLETPAPSELPLHACRSTAQTDIPKPIKLTPNHHQRAQSDSQVSDLALQRISDKRIATSKLPIRVRIEKDNTSAIDCLAAVAKLHTLSESLAKQRARMTCLHAHHCSDISTGGSVQFTKTPFSTPEGVSKPFQGSLEGQALATSQLDLSAGIPVIVSQSGGLTISRGVPWSQSLETTDSSTVDSCYLRPEPRSRPKKYPPRAFPVDFYERFPDPDPIFPYGVINLDIPPIASEISEPKPKDEKLSNMLSCLQTPSTHEADLTSVEQSTFYKTVHWFTDCPHASPPATRPLNSQPYVDPNCHPDDFGITRSIIDGACFECDSQQRRDDEDLIVDKYTLRLGKFAKQLGLLIRTLEIDNAASDLEVEDEALNSSIANAIRILEEEIDQLRDMEESEVKAVWAGYTARWGPATLGVQRSTYKRISTEDDWPLRRDPENGTGRALDTSLGVASSDSDGICKDETQLLSTPRSLSQTESSQGSRTVSSSSRGSESSNGTSVSPGEGRMKIDWIRPDRG